jgi:amidase
MKDELISLDAIALGELVRKKEVTPTKLLEITIQRIEKINPKLNAVIHKMYDQARETAANWGTEVHKGRAEGVIFCGVPFLLKDLIAEYKSAPFHEGSRAVEGYISKIDTELVKRQKAGGLVIVGKTNTPEFGALPTTEPILNPWRIKWRICGGGSCGHCADGSWKRRRRFNSHPGLLLRPFRS